MLGRLNEDTSVQKLNKCASFHSDDTFNLLLNKSALIFALNSDVTETHQNTKLSSDTYHYGVTCHRKGNTKRLTTLYIFLDRSVRLRWNNCALRNGKHPLYTQTNFFWQRGQGCRKVL